MSTQALLLLILVVSVLVVGIAVTGCVVFMRFMQRERQRGESELVLPRAEGQQTRVRDDPP